ncbi:MAG: hypothetical protein WCS72_05220 [Deltaproteobacteria bacterium]
MIDAQDATGKFPDLEERLASAESAPEEPTGVLWEQGPVELPVETLPELAPAESPIPPPDPAFAAVVVELPEIIPEVGADDVEEIVEELVEEPAAPVVEATVSWLDEEGPTDDVVSLDALLATPPPANAESLAPPLPPPLPHPPPASPALAPPAEEEPHPTPEPDPFAASLSFVSGDHRVVLHTVEGQVLRGSIANADLADAELPLMQPNGAVARVPAEHVKAVFFMLPTGDRPPPAAGTRVRVTFADGRQISGLSPDYSPDSLGFFVLPLDTRTNTARVWVYRGSARQITVG